MSDSRTVGVVGVGTMGSSFVNWLCADEHPTVAFDIDDDRMAIAAEAGAARADHPADLADRADVILLSLPGSAYVEAAMEGNDGVLAGLGEADVVLDTGTSRIETDRHYRERCLDVGAELLDAPITWGGPGERVSMFIGGTDDAVQKVRPILETITAQYAHLGRLGAGQVAKAAHRLRQNNHAMVDAEIVEFMRQAGVDPEAVDDLLELGIHGGILEQSYSGTAGWQRAPDEPPECPSVEDAIQMHEGPDRPRMDVSHWAKDHAYAIEIGHATRAALPISSAAYQTLLASENYAQALLERPLVFQDDEWYDRSDPVAHYRRMNRPAEEWHRLERAAED